MRAGRGPVCPMAHHRRAGQALSVVLATVRAPRRRRRAGRVRDLGQGWGQTAEGDTEQERWGCPGRAKEAGASMGLGLKMKG